MASLFAARDSQTPAAQSTNGRMSTLRSTNGAASDPLQYLHNMAEQVGKEVDLFAERVDLWHTRGNESKRAKYQATMTMIDDFKDVAATRVKELKKEHEQEHKMELSHSVRRRVEKMAKGPNPSAANAHEGSRRLSTQSADSDDEEFEAERKDKVENLRQWQAELATWELVQIIVEHHHPEPETDPAATRQERLATVGGNKRYSPNSEVWDRFLLEDDKAKEKAIILRWLEQTAQNDRSGLETMTEVIQAQAERNVSTWTNGWLDTKVTIQQAKRLENIEKPLQPGSLTLQTRDKTQDLVTQLDPDAPARQKRALEQKDEYYERSMWMVCYEMLRRGLPWKDICEWAQEKNEAWRGVSVGAAYEAHPNGGPNLAGPTVGFLFRRTCFYAARGARSPYEAAVYGLLSGDLKQAQTHPACQSWHDHLYAHYNALLLSRFDTYLLQNHPHRVPESMTAKFLFQDAVTHIGNWETASEQVIDLLKRQKGMEGLSTKPFALLQGALIGRKLSALMIQVGLAIADMQNDDERPFSLLLRPDTAGALEGMESVGNERLSTTADCYKDLARNPHTLRILTHLFIIFHGVMGRQREPASADPNKWMAMDNVVTTYIEFLRVTKKLDLIPLYAAQLTPERAGHCLARVLPDIKNHDEQRRSVALMEAYGIDVVEVTVQMFQYACHLIGFTHLVGFKANGDSVVGVTNPIKRFKILEPTPSDNVLWPGFRIQHVFEGSDIEPAEEALIEALQWYHYTSNDFDQTFQHMWHALSILLLKGRLQAAEIMVKELSVETLSLSRTEALCGYPFDFTQPGSDEQDEAELYNHRKIPANATARTAMLKESPSAEKHAATVHRLLKASTPYHDVQLIVRLLQYFRAWRAEEDELIKCRAQQQAQAQDVNAPKMKQNLIPVKELLEQIGSTFNTLIASISESVKVYPNSQNGMDWDLRRAYIPEIVLAYLSVLQIASFFLQRESSTSTTIRAMEVANLVADDDNKWLQKVFLETGRMGQLVESLAHVSRAMLQVNEQEPKKGAIKKRGSRGETMRIWDLMARERL